MYTAANPVSQGKMPAHLTPDTQMAKSTYLERREISQTQEGSTQGSPLSPLLSNIMLNELDKELEKRGVCYVRYADDFSIYTKSNSKARKTGNEIYLFLKNKLKLPINREKSGIRKPVNFTILGFGFVPTYVKGEKGKYQLVVSEKGWKTLKLKIKTITRKTTPANLRRTYSETERASQGLARILPNG